MVDAIDEQLAYDEQANPFDANDPEAIAEAEKKAASLKAKRLRVVESIMASEDGRAWMFDFLGVNCHVFSENRLEGERSARFEGERAVGLHVLDEVMTAAPEQFWQMRKEAIERERQ
jgi:hypothetical protein